MFTCMVSFSVSFPKGFEVQGNYNFFYVVLIQVEKKPRKKWKIKLRGKGNGVEWSEGKIYT